MRATSFMPGWYPPGGSRSARVDDQQVRAGNGSAGDEDRPAERPASTALVADAPLARPLQPRVEAARAGRTYSAHGPSPSRTSEPASRPSVVGSSSTIFSPGRPSATRTPRPRAEDRVGDVVGRVRRLARQPLGELGLRPVELDRRPAHAQRGRAAAARSAPGFASPPGTPSNTRRPPGQRVVGRRLAAPGHDLERGAAEGDREGRLLPGVPRRTRPRAAARARRRVAAGSSACHVRRAHSPHSSRRSGDSPPEANPSRSYSRSAGALPLNTPR